MIPMLSLAVALAACLWAQDKTPNPNEGLNPTAPATQAPAAADTPTYPAGRNQPPSRGGSLGYDPALEDQDVRERKERAEEARRRRNKEPEAGVAVPKDAEDYPRALEGGTQP